MGSARNPDKLSGFGFSRYVNESPCESRLSRTVIGFYVMSVDGEAFERFGIIVQVRKGVKK